jgi:NitT/TauT family transport system ATP-binding protein
LNIKITDLSKGFGKLTIFDRFNLTLESGSRHCLFGPSGCGKTTLLNLIAGLEFKDGGMIEGVNQKKTAYVFQEERLIPWLTVRENINFVVDGKGIGTTDEAHLEAILDLVELTAFQNHYPSELSGGMKQRVSLARAFAYNGEILVLDEPFKGLHHDLKLRLMDYVLKYWELERPHLIFTTHDVEEAVYLSTDIFVLEGPPVRIKKHIQTDDDAIYLLKG